MENINVSYPDDGLGDKLRNAFIKVNENFIELSDSVALKIGDAPSDNKIYVRKNGEWFEYEGTVTPADIAYLQGLIDDLYDTKVDKVAGSRLITALEVAIIANQSGINTGDQDLSDYAKKHNPTFTGSVIVPNSTLDTQAVNQGQLNTKQKKVSSIYIDVDTILSSIHEGAILIVRDFVTLFVPSGLAGSFTSCVIDVKAGHLTVIQGAGTTITGAYSLLIPNGETTSLFKETTGTNLFRLK